MEKLTTPDGKAAKRGVARKVTSWCAFILLLILCAVLLVHSLLCVFKDGYYPTFGDKRLFAIVSDSMEPEIPTGNMIVSRVPKTPDEITVGSVITFEVRDGDNVTLITHRVTEIRIDEETGLASYATKGDNAPRGDSLHPTYNDVVGVFTGKKCGFFGYFFGFLQSAEGAITLIIIILIIVLTYIIVRFVTLVNIWRKVAMDAMAKSGELLADSENKNSHTVADVLGIVAKEPANKRDLNKKDKKLRWFMRTGTLPERPYRDDFDEAEAIAMLQKQHEDTAKSELAYEKPDISEPAASANVCEQTQSEAKGEPARVEKQIEQEFTPPQVISSFEEVAAAISPQEQKSVRALYDFTFRARLIQLKPDSKEWYSVIKNKLMSYQGITAVDSKSCERYVLARKTVVRMSVNGKTLCVSLALDPERYENSKYKLFRNKSNTPTKIKITSARQAKYATELIIDMMNDLGIAGIENYEPQDFYMPYEGIASLLSKNLVKRKKVKIPHVLEDCERMSYDMTFSARLTQLSDESKDWYSIVKNELMSYSKVRVKDGKRGETYMYGRKTIAKMNVRGKTVCLLLALDPANYKDAKYKVTAIKNEKTPLKYRLSSSRRTDYALELIGDLMTAEQAEKNLEYSMQDFRPEYENIVNLMNMGLAKRRLTNKTQEFAVELVKQ